MHSLLSGQSYRRVGSSSSKGPEWHGPCPVCGGNDRFHVWPEQGAGTFWCRAEEKGGDLIEFYRWKDGLSYREACERAGQDAKTYTPQSQPSARRGDKAPTFVPRPADPVVALWSEHAAKFAEWCQVQLLDNPVQLAWLATRGVDAGLVTRFCLGWNPADTWRAREAWALPTLRNDAGKPKKLWLPQGLVIPQRINGTVVRLRIRRPEGEPKYYVVPGSGREPFVTGEESAYVVVESELDAICLAGRAGDLVGCVAMGNSTAKPTAALWRLLERAVHVSVALDSDQPQKNQRSGKMEAPGAAAARWWLETVPVAERVPVVGGKDPGEAYAAGVDLRAWVLAGLPPRYHLKERIRRDNAAAQAAQETAVQTPVSEPDPAGPQVKHYQLTVAGREIHVTDNRDVWEELTAAGEIVFSEQELLRLQAALTGLDEPVRAESIERVIDAKQIFTGAYVRRGEIVSEQEVAL
jgi:hypothetical protein